MRTWTLALAGLAALVGCGPEPVRIPFAGSPDAMGARIVELHRCWIYDEEFGFLWGYGYDVVADGDARRFDFYPVGGFGGLRRVRLVITVRPGEVEASGPHMGFPEARERIGADLARAAAGEGGCGPRHVPMVL